MAKKNAINNQSQELTIDPGASGDSFVQFDINGTGEFRVGVDDSDSDAFVISQGSALGTNNTFKMTSFGERTMPLQSCFQAHRNANLTDVTGDGTVYTIVWDSEEFDQGGNFDGTSTFTAPTTGIYKMICELQTLFLDAGHTVQHLDIVTTGDTYRRIVNPFAYKGGNSGSQAVCAIIPMTATDTATVAFTVSGGAKNVDIQGNSGAGAVVSSFSGCLIC